MPVEQRDHAGFNLQFLSRTQSNAGEFGRGDIALLERPNLGTPLAGEEEGDFVGGLLFVIPLGQTTVSSRTI